MGKNKFNQSYVGPRPDVLKLIPTGIRTVLDIGCSTGELGQAIKEKTGATVIGVDTSVEMAAVAKEKNDKVIIGNIEDQKTLEQIENKKFDVIILADVLEHLINPWQTLKKLTNFLSPSGVVIASIPNVGHLDTLYNLLINNYWPYRDRGIHDRTHMRFFTLKNIGELFKEAGLKIEKINVNYRIIETPHFINKYAKYFALPGLRNLLAFQYLIVARKIK